MTENELLGTPSSGITAEIAGGFEALPWYVHLCSTRSCRASAASWAVHLASLEMARGFFPLPIPQMLAVSFVLSLVKPSNSKIASAFTGQLPELEHRNEQASSGAVFWSTAVPKRVDLLPWC